MDPVVLQTTIIGLVGMVCGAILAISARFLAVHEDPRIETVGAMLPGINCGSCGFGGCAEYAKAIVSQGAEPNLCKPGGGSAVHKIASFLGVKAAVAERAVALVLCNGSAARSRRSTLYNGIADCSAADLVGGGGKSCRFGCMGFGSCSRVCPVQAIEMNDQLAVVHPELCIECGKCVAACPRKLIKLVPESRSIHVLCVSQDRGPDVKRVCDVGCVGCTLCVKTCNGQGIRMDGNLAVVDYAAVLDNEAVIAKCPQHTIVRRSGVRQVTP